MTIADPRSRVGRDTARRVIPLFRPYRGRVVIVVGLIVLTSTIGIVNPLLIQAVFNKALFVPGGPKLDLLYILIAVMAAVMPGGQLWASAGQNHAACSGSVR